jgi:hypothetical protein
MEERLKIDATPEGALNNNLPAIAAPSTALPANQSVFSDTDLRDLRLAVKQLEQPSIGARAANIIGTPIEKILALLPHSAMDTIGSAAQKAIGGALKIALKTMDIDEQDTSSDWWHLGATALTGAASGAFGLAALAFELPVTTGIMLRSIADVARSEGANLADPAVQLECVSVFALGGKADSDDGAEIGYFLAREGLTKVVADATSHIAKNGLQKEGAPALVRLILVIAERYSIQISEKAAAQAVPIIGAAGGAIINTIFMDHFQSVARGHFIVRRLEKQHGEDLVKAKYGQLRQELRNR